MDMHVVVGAGPVGRATARLLTEQGHAVRLVNRSGSGPDVPGAQRVAADASHADDVAAVCSGSVAIYNCVNPAYDRWPADWPPIAASLLVAAERSAAVLVTTGNLYPYGPVNGAITEDLPDAGRGTKARVRAQMWADALAAHRAGRVHAVEVRASDYIGPDDVQSHLNRALPRVLAEKAVRVFGSADEPHSWTYVPDVARMLVTAATDERAWGRIWHAPTSAPRTQREALHDLCRAAGVAPVRVGALPHVVLRAVGLVNPMVRELEETRYQFVRPFVLDSTAAQSTFGLEPTPWDVVCATTVEWARAASRHSAVKG